MTDAPVIVPPALYLPVHPLAEAEACLDRARAALALAKDVAWVSTIADAYRGELEALDARVASAAGAVDHARDRLTAARWAAYERGQL